MIVKAENSPGSSEAIRFDWICILCGTVDERNERAALVALHAPYAVCMEYERENQMGVDYAHVAQPLLVTTNHSVLLLKMSNQIHATYKMRCFEEMNKLKMRCFGKIYVYIVEIRGILVKINGNIEQYYEISKKNTEKYLER